MMRVERHSTAESFLNTAKACLMAAEAENNLIIGILEGLLRDPSAAQRSYLATVGDDAHSIACAVHLPPFKLLLTRATRDAVAALANDAFSVVPTLDGVSGPERSAADFAAAWNAISGAQPRIGMRLRIQEAKTITDSGLPVTSGAMRQAGDADCELLTEWTELFATDARIEEQFDAAAIVTSSLKRGRLYVWDDNGVKSMAAWVGKTPNGVRLNSIFTLLPFRGRGYATACVSALAKMHLDQGSAFCWLYTDILSEPSGNMFKRIGFRPVSDVVEYIFGR